LPAIGLLDTETEYLVLRSTWQKPWDFNLPRNFHFYKVPLSKELSVWRRLIWEQFSLPQFVRDHNVDIIFCPTDIASLFSPGKTVLAIRNLNVYIGNDLKRGLGYFINRKLILRTMTWISAKKASRVIFMSNYMRSVVCRQLSIPYSKTEVIHHGLKPDFFKKIYEIPEWIKQLPRPYLLSVSAIKAHKNYPFLVRAFFKVIKNLNLPHHIVLAGQLEFHNHITEMRQIAEEAGMSDRLHLLGTVHHNELPALYQQADIFVFPSLIESFGLPLIEAMASGIPIVVSNVTAHPEICADAAVYFDPKDITEISNKISQVITDRSLRNQLVSRGLTRATEFSWKVTAEKTIALLKDA
jgi:glycosyltransferase involved in cell wall biosynthesis